MMGHPISCRKSTNTHCKRPGHLTLADGSRVKRYIVEFKCRVRNITFVEKYMSVSASGGTGRVATILFWRTRPALQSEGVGSQWTQHQLTANSEVFIPDGQCMIEGRDA